MKIIKKICLFGIYDPLYSRSKELISGLAGNGIDVMECNVDPKIHVGWRKYQLLFRKGCEIRKQGFDIVIVGYPGQGVVWLAKLIFYRVPIIFDAFLSLYDSNVFDRKIYSKYSFGAVKDYFLDFYSCKFAKKIILDTRRHIEYFANTFHINIAKFVRLPVGADMNLFYPRERKDNSERFVVYFHGNFIPLQGVQYIVEAAKFLKNEDIFFRIVGMGQEYKSIEKFVSENNLTNVELLGRKKLEELPGLISSSDLCLGIFGATAKVGRVVPNKVYECMAMGRPILTADTPAIRELIGEKDVIMLCQSANGKSIADSIIQAKNDISRLDLIGTAGYEYFRNNFETKKIVGELINELQKIL